MENNNEIDKLIKDLTEDKLELYQSPVKVGKAGKPIDEGDELWIVGTFLPGQYINETHKTGHNGTDLKAPLGTSIYPIASGIVIETQNYPKGGITCKISHENGKVTSYYAHLSQRNVQVGQSVTPSTVIGLVGDTGNAKGRGAHLHYEVKSNGSHINPLSIIGKPVGSLANTLNRKDQLQQLAFEISQKNCLIKLAKQYLGNKKTPDIEGLITSFDDYSALGNYLKYLKNN